MKTKFSVSRLFGPSWPIRNGLCSKATVKNEDLINVKPFECIPGPKGLPLLGNLWRYMPLIGEYDLQRMDRNGLYNLKRYGKIVREEISHKHKIVHLFDPIDMESMFRQQHHFPYRRSHRALLKYRYERPEIYQSGGIFPENGHEWARLRDLFKHYFLVADNINQYDEQLNLIVFDLVNFIKETRHPINKQVDNFQLYLYRWSLESISAIMLDDRIQCLQTDPRQIQDGLKMIDAGHKTIYSVMRTELYDSWEQDIFSKDYYRLVGAQDMMAEVVQRYLGNKYRKLQDPKSSRQSSSSEETILTKMIGDPKISKKDLFGIVMDFVLAGIDTTSITSAFAIYFLAKHVHVQDRLRKEILQAQGQDPYFKAEHFHQTPYLKACIKETLRLRPISIGVGRVATDDLIVGGYHIPKNTMIITQNQVSCQLKEYYNEPNYYKPERWLTGHNDMKLAKEHRFLFIPFGYGTRMCLGRRIAELEMYILVANLLKYFYLHYDPLYPPIGQRTRLINIPDRPIRLIFIDR